MKAIHGGKAKNDKIDAHKIAVLVRGGMLPMAYVYPREMRETRDLLRRRCHFTRQRAELLTRIQNTASQYQRPALGKIAYHGTREGVAERFGDPEVRKSAYRPSEDASLAVSTGACVRAAQIVATTCSMASPRSRPLARTAPAVSMSDRHGGSR